MVFISYSEFLENFVTILKHFSRILRNEISLNFPDRMAYQVYMVKSDGLQLSIVLFSGVFIALSNIRVFCENI